MAITSATRFQWVYVTYQTTGAGVVRVSVQETDNTVHLWRFGPTKAAVTGTSLTNLEALQGIYASASGFQDASDNALAMVVQGYDSGYADTLEEYEALGHFNPLKAGSYEAWKAGLRSSFGAALKHAGVSVNADTGRIDVESSAGNIPVKRIPDDGTMEQSLEDWTVVFSGGRANFRLLPRAGETFDPATAIQDDKRIPAFLKWLDDHRVTGDAVPLTGSSLTDFHNAINDRNYSIEQSPEMGSSNVVVVTLASSGYGPTLVSATLEYVSGASILVPQLNALIDAATVTIDTDQADEEPPRGSTDVRQRMERAEFADGQIVSERGHPTWKGDDGRKRTMGGSYGEEVDWTDLTAQSATVGGVTTTWRNVPLLYGLRSIHDGGTGDNITRIPEPEDIVPNQGESLDVEIHKSGASGSHTVQNHDGSVALVTLLPGERVALRAVWRDDGGQEIRSIGHIDRVYEFAGTTSSFAASRFSTVNYFAEVSDRYRPIVLPSGDNISVDRRNTDTFERAGTATYTDGASLSNLYLPQSVKVLKAGRTRVELDLSIRSAAGGSGTIPNGHGVQLLRNGVLLEPAVVYRVMGIDENRAWFLVTELDLAAGDIITPLFHYPSSTSMAMSSIEVAFYRLRLDTEHLISLETT